MAFVGAAVCLVELQLQSFQRHDTALAAQGCQALLQGAVLGSAGLG